MVLKIVDKGGMHYPEVVNAETGEKVEKVISIVYQATPMGRTCCIEFIGEFETEMSYTSTSKIDYNE